MGTPRNRLRDRFIVEIYFPFTHNDYTMKIKYWFLLISLVILHGCQPSNTKSEKQILRTALCSDVMSLDPRKGVSPICQGVLRALFRGLVRLDNEQIPRLELAESYHISDDYTTYTFTLKDCYWSNGSPITAHDFEHTWKAALTPAYTSTCSNLLFHLKNGRKAFLGQISIDHVGVKALDNKTLVVELESPSPHFLNVLAHAIYSPVHESMRYSPPNPSKLVTSGPFLLKKYIFQDKILLAKNKRYWNASNIQLDEIHYYIIKDLETALLMFEKKELDWLGYPLTRIPHESVPGLISKGILQTSLTAGIQWLFINTQKFPLNNIHIRKALAYAIDRQTIIKELLNLEQIPPSLSLIPKITKREKWHPWFQDNDVAQAKAHLEQGLKELNISPDQFPEIKIAHAGSNNSKLMQVVQQMWKKNLGIDVKLDQMEPTQLFSNWYAQSYDISVVGWVLQYNDPVNMMEIFQHKDVEPNYTGWENTEFIQHTISAIKATNEGERWQHIEEAEKIFFNEMPSIPIFEYVTAHVEQPYVKGVRVSPLHLIDFDDASIEKETAPHEH